MIENEADINLPINTGDTPLHQTIQYVRTPVVALLIKAGALINATNQDLNTPLHSIGISENEFADLFSRHWCENDASYYDDYYYIAELLIKNGADVNANNTDGKTPLELITNEKSKFSITFIYTN